MVSVDNAVIARFKKGNNTFEVLVDCNLAIALKNGQTTDTRMRLSENWNCSQINEFKHLSGLDTLLNHKSQSGGIQ